MGDLKGARVLVTGGNGFLGAFVSAALEVRGATVMNVSRQSGYDIRNEAEILSACLLAKPTSMVHLATPRGAKTAGTFRDTLQMGLNVIHAAALMKAHLIVLSDASIYPLHPAVRPTSPHGKAKWALLDLAGAYREQYGLRSVFVASTELYGIGVIPGGFVPFAAIQFDSARKEKRTEVGFSGSQTDPLPLLHAADAADAIAKTCASQVDQAEPLNLASPEPEASFGHVVKTIASRLGYDGRIDWSPDGEKPLRLVGDHTEKTLGWSPKILLRDGLEEAVSWVKGDRRGGS